MKNSILLLSIIILGFFASCTKDRETSTASEILVLNEGFFNSANSSISSYDPESKMVTQNVYKNANNGAPIGDILQSAKLVQDELYLVVNNSHKIIVVNPTTLVMKRTLILPENASPRYIEQGSGDELLVTDIFDTKVSRINKITGQVLGSVELGVNTEELVRVGTKVYVANPGPYTSPANTISVIETTNYSFTKIETSAVNFVSVKADNAGLIWALATGNYDDKTGKLIVIDSDNNSILKTIDIGGSPTDLALNTAKNEAYILNSSGIQVVDLKSFVIKNASLIEGNFYAINVDDKEQKLYVTDPKDYTSNGLLKVFSITGDLLHEVTVGVNPGFVYIAE
jgi:hypothetical protein